MLEVIAKGVLAGVMYSLSGFAKKENQDFDAGKFLTTAIVGGFAGLGMALSGVDLATSHQLVLGMGATAAIENVLKAVYRKVLMYFME